MIPGNIFESIPDKLPEEFFEVILQKNNVKVERIVSKGHSSPASGWYDQNQDEWVIVLKGAARILFEGDQEIQLSAGSHVNIPAHTKHRVSWTLPDTETVWLAIFY